MLAGFILNSLMDQAILSISEMTKLSLCTQEVISAIRMLALVYGSAVGFFGSEP